MRSLLRVLPVLGVVAMGFVVASAIGGGETAVQAAGPQVNACGCYRDAVGACFCGKKGKCSCPGECEPKGCEEKRSKEIDKEVEVEIKRARDAEKKQHDEEADKKRKAAAAADESEGMDTGSVTNASEGQSSGDSTDQQGDTTPRGKKAKKGKRVKETKKSKDQPDAPKE